jgi:hypothetical protein
VDCYFTSRTLMDRKKKIVRGAIYVVMGISGFAAWAGDAGFTGYLIWLAFLWLVIVAPVWAIVNISEAGRMWLPGPDLAIFGAKHRAPSPAPSHPSSEGHSAPPALPPQ